MRVWTDEQKQRDAINNWLRWQRGFLRLVTMQAALRREKNSWNKLLSRTLLGRTYRLPALVNQMREWGMMTRYLATEPDIGQKSLHKSLQNSPQTPLAPSLEKMPQSGIHLASAA